MSYKSSSLTNHWLRRLLKLKLLYSGSWSGSHFDLFNSDRGNRPDGQFAGELQQTATAAIMRGHYLGGVLHQRVDLLDALGGQHRGVCRASAGCNQTTTHRRVLLGG